MRENGPESPPDGHGRAPRADLQYLRASTDRQGVSGQGHRAQVVARATIRCRRIVAIELATCRSGRTGGASGFAILGNAKRRELIGGSGGGGGGKPRPLGDQEGVGCDAQRGVMMEAAPAASF